MSILIAIAGEAEHGKDTIGNIIDELWKELHYISDMKFHLHSQFELIKFADPINKTICAITGLSLEYVTNKDNYDKPIAWLGNKTLRDLKQGIGQGMKKVLGEDIWIKSSFSKVRPNTPIKVTDLRFPLELDFCTEEAVKLFEEVILIYVERPGHVANTLAAHNKTDISETIIKTLDKSRFHHYIINDTSRKELKEKVKQALETHKSWKVVTSSIRDF